MYISGFLQKYDRFYRFYLFCHNFNLEYFVSIQRSVCLTKSFLLYVSVDFMDIGNPKVTPHFVSELKAKGRDYLLTVVCTGPEAAPTIVPIGKDILNILD